VTCHNLPAVAHLFQPAGNATLMISAIKEMSTIPTGRGDLPQSACSCSPVVAGKTILMISAPKEMK